MTTKYWLNLNVMLTSHLATLSGIVALLNNGKTTGPDDILHVQSSVASEPRHLIQLSLLAHSQVFKKGDKSTPANHRLIYH